MSNSVDKATAWDMLIAAREDEREKCAKIAESFQRSHKDFSVALTIAKAIRQRADRVGGSPSDR